MHLQYQLKNQVLTINCETEFFAFLIVLDFTKAVILPKTIYEIVSFLHFWIPCEI